ncbi:hypothetical protein ITX31_02465 [Arthrobacter gandavensis]|uniref:hypothetical protein n=1 Tax=Arthrobacter gandavensis TaxID=169960 RepID=UPI00188E3312|nr:hypothetical protein [Arthrobacter gandavensis]MBF4992974.1 hypothetical protein [Arthrobacter gandavensis]
MIDDFILNEYKARRHWENREYSDALAYAQRAASIAQNTEDQDGWGRMVFLVGRCQREMGQMAECAETATVLVQHAVTCDDRDLEFKARALHSVALQALGQLPKALAIARSAADSPGDERNGYESTLETQQVLVAVLAESGDFDAAWREAQDFAAMIGHDTKAEVAGKAFWAIGNAAFLIGRHREAVHYHGLASAALSPTNDVSLWALFNKASAFMRLTANLVEPETLQCIERAEMAISITGGTPQDEIELAITRAYWSFLTGDLTAARSKMNAVMEKSEIMAPHIEGEAVFLLARILRAEGQLADADDRFAQSAHLFEEAGAGARAEQSRRFMSHSPEPFDG